MSCALFKDLSLHLIFILIPSFFYLILLLSTILYPVPSHSCDPLEDLLSSLSQFVFSSALLDDEDLNLWWSYGFTFIIGEFLCFSFQLSPIDWQTVESSPCSTSTYIYSHGLDCTSSLGLFMKTLVLYLWTKLRKIMFYPFTQLPDLWRLITIVYYVFDPPL